MRRRARNRSKWIWAGLLGGAWALSSLVRPPALSARIGGAPVPAAPTAVVAASPNLAKTQSRPLRESDLRGLIDLDKMVLVDDHFEVPLADGRRAILTLDPDLQRAAEETLLKAKAPVGAIAVTSTDGRILALTGRRHDKPGADFSLPTTVWAPAASIFKVVTAAALVDAGVKPDDDVCYHGGWRGVDRGNLVDDARRDNQCNDLRYGLAHSQNAIIAKLAHKHLSQQGLVKMASKFGFGQDLDSCLPIETARANIPEEPLAFSQVAAGFWNTEISPLSGALIANLVATGGIGVNPRLVDRVIAADGVATPLPSGEQKRVLAADIAERVGAMMRETCESGTAAKAFRDKRGRKYLGEVSVAGKTGTLNRKGGDYLQYSWFVGFAPAENPEVSISVLLGNGELWHLKAHTAARLVLEQAL